MRSLLSPAPAEERSDPAGIESPSTAARAPADPPQAGPETSLQSKLYTVTERLAVALVERAEKELLVDRKDSDPALNIAELQKTVMFGMDLLVKLPKLRPADEEEGAGVNVLREMMADPASVVDRLHGNAKFIEALEAKGWLRPVKNPSHRPTKAQQEERAAYEQRKREVTRPPDDDSELARLLGKGEEDDG